MTRQLLARADELYHRSEAGIACLPPKVRPAMFAARHIYAAIGNSVRANGFDNISVRARTTKATKLRLLGLSATHSMVSMFYAHSSNRLCATFTADGILGTCCGYREAYKIGME